MEKQRNIVVGFLFISFVISGCGPEQLLSPTITVTPTLTPTSTPIPSLTPVLTANPIPETEKLVKGFAAAWAAHDSDQLLSYYSENVKSYDATIQGIFFDYSTIKHVLQGGSLGSVFEVAISSFFVSDDGCYATTVGTYAEKDASGKFDPVPYVSLIEVREGKIVWVYDYYGGALSEVFPLQVIPESANLPAASKQLIAKTRDMITHWKTSYNSRDVQAFISYYADQTSYSQVIAPEWHVFTKDTLLQDVTSKFNDEEFMSTLNDFFVSADGHFVAMQGFYDDAESDKIPMVILLETKNGKIVEQYDYLVYTVDSH